MCAEGGKTSSGKGMRLLVRPGVQDLQGEGSQVWVMGEWKAHEAGSVLGGQQFLLEDSHLSCARHLGLGCQLHSPSDPTAWHMSLESLRNGILSQLIQEGQVGARFDKKEKGAPARGSRKQEFSLCGWSCEAAWAGGTEKGFKELDLQSQRRDGWSLGKGKAGRRGDPLAKAAERGRSPAWSARAQQAWGRLGCGACGACG